MAKKSKLRKASKFTLQTLSAQQFTQLGTGTLQQRKLLPKKKRRQATKLSKRSFKGAVIKYKLGTAYAARANRYATQHIKTVAQLQQRAKKRENTVLRVLNAERVRKQQQNAQKEVKNIRNAAQRNNLHATREKQNIVRNATLEEEGVRLQEDIVAARARLEKQIFDRLLKRKRNRLEENTRNDQAFKQAKQLLEKKAAAKYPNAETRESKLAAKLVELEATFEALQTQRQRERDAQNIQNQLNARTARDELNAKSWAKTSALQKKLGETKTAEKTRNITLQQMNATRERRENVQRVLQKAASQKRNFVVSTRLQQAETMGRKTNAPLIKQAAVAQAKEVTNRQKAGAAIGTLQTGSERTMAGQMLLNEEQRQQNRFSTIKQARAV
jgi:hypothetical protein